MDRANSRAGPSNPPTIVGRLSRLLRPSQITASSSSSTITTTPGKTFVVPLFLSTSRPSTRNNLFGQGTLPPTSRSLSSRQARIDNRMPRARDLPPSSTRRPDVDEGSDMYTASDPDGQTPAALDSGPRARNTDDVRSTSSSRGTCSVRSGAVIRSGRSSARSGSPSTNSSRGASRSTNSSSRVQSRRRVVRSASAKSNHDSRVSAKARISFAFGITLLIAMVICRLALASTCSWTSWLGGLLTMMGRCGACVHENCQGGNVPRAFDPPHPDSGGGVFPPVPQYVDVEKATCGGQTSKWDPAYAQTSTSAETRTSTGPEERRRHG